MDSPAPAPDAARTGHGECGTFLGRTLPGLRRPPPRRVHCLYPRGAAGYGPPHTKRGVCLKGLINDQSLIYRQIADLLENGILNGEFAEEAQVPSTTELARVFAINPATAAKGVNRLVDEGLLYKKRGIGMFVAKGAAAALRKKRQQLFVQQALTQLVREAAQLGMTREELLRQLSIAADKEGLL